MVDWSDNAVRATVAVAILNIGLLGANIVKNSRDIKADTPVATPVDPTEAEIQAITDSMVSPSNIEANCIELAGWKSLSEVYPELSRDLLTSDTAKPCLNTGTTFLDTETALDIASIAASTFEIETPNSAPYFACLQEKTDQIVGRSTSGSEFNASDSDVLPKAIAVARAFCLKTAGSIND